MFTLCLLLKFVVISFNIYRNSITVGMGIVVHVKIISSTTRLNSQDINEGNALISSLKI